MEVLSFAVFIFSILNLIFALFNCFAIKDLILRNKNLATHNEMLLSIIKLQNKLIKAGEGEKLNDESE